MQWIPVDLKMLTAHQSKTNLLQLFLGVLLSAAGLQQAGAKSLSNARQLAEKVKKILHDGDLIFQNRRTKQGRAVEYATGSRYSHMGIVFIRNDQPYVLEAIKRVTYTPLRKWIKRGRNHLFVVKRLRNAGKLLGPEKTKRLRTEAEKHLGKRYDTLFGWDDDRFYCSELAWKTYFRATGLVIGAQKKLADFNLTHPAVRRRLARRYGNHIPYQMSVVSPADIFHSRLLVTVTVQNPF